MPKRWRLPAARRISCPARAWSAAWPRRSKAAITRPPCRPGCASFRRRYHAARLAGQLAAGTELHAAVIFGNERFGLPNEIVEQCNVLINIPANPEYSSLNLSQAAQVWPTSAAWRPSMRRVKRLRPAPSASMATAASVAQIEGMYAHLEQALVAIDFLDADNPAS
jgi:tRNA C32,U32 (ribose-2'-O)-methylase TrmJ